MNKKTINIKALNGLITKLFTSKRASIPICKACGAMQDDIEGPLLCCQSKSGSFCHDNISTLKLSYVVYQKILDFVYNDEKSYKELIKLIEDTEVKHIDQIFYYGSTKLEK
ncbi:hypothetical protein [Rhizosphaericola mali]|uniref:Uncharacterized protein n=1 Tax=Rhizosphaericola mali TaxID=2545455 RepID=A0A5P2FXE8_9BACT|nr:hypothetical protein [Rhizosphaericola mali]QES87607.1 hypothetical protein E0W69_002630 [Rhizosphaericola mali]